MTFGQHGDGANILEISCIFAFAHILACRPLKCQSRLVLVLDVEGNLVCS